MWNFKRAVKTPRRGKTIEAGNRVFLHGPCGVGKTHLLYLLSGITPPETVSSLKIATSPKQRITEDSKKEYVLVDVPGHLPFKEQLYGLLEDSKSKSGVIVLVDSSSPNSIIQSSDFIYDLLIRKVVQKRETPILIVFNFQDKQGAVSVEAAIEILEKEL